MKGDGRFNASRLKVLAVNAIDQLASRFRKPIPDFIHVGPASSDKKMRCLVMRRKMGVIPGGLCWYVLAFANASRWAFDNNYIPVVDMRTDKSIYHEDDEVGKVNVWDRYFNQPGGVSLDEAMSKGDVTISPNTSFKCECIQADEPFLSGRNGELAKWRSFVRRHFIPVDAVADEINKERAKVFGSTQKDVLGVFLRGTDYTRLRPTGHSLQPEPKDAIRDASKMLKEHHLSRIFLATEDKRIIDMFRAEFKDSLIIKEQNLADYKGGYIGNNRPGILRKRERYLQGLDYLVNIWLFSECPCILSSLACGSIFASVLASDTQIAHYWFERKYGRFLG